MLDHLPELVVKAANESGGYGMLVGPALDQGAAGGVRRADRGQPAQLHRAADAVAVARARPSSTARFEGRHVDLRPYILYGKDIFVLPGGLTRVALKKGSLVVNSSQGGGSKDTWVLADDPARRRQLATRRARRRQRRSRSRSRSQSSLGPHS